MDQPRVGDQGERAPVASAPLSAEGTSIPDAIYDRIFRSPSLFGRIVLVASFRNTLAVDEPGSPAQHWAVAAQDELRDLHLDVFRAWLLHPVRRQAADMNMYLNQSGRGDLRQLVALGERSMPLEAESEDREMFLHDLKMVQILLANRVE